MGSTSESGHAVNLNNMQLIISAIRGFGAAYEPSNGLISLPNLTKNLSDSQKAFETFIKVDSENKGLINKRAAAFKKLTTRVTQIMGEARSSTMPKPSVDNVKSIVDKMRGTRVSAKLTDEQKKKLADEGKEVNQVSASQLSFANKISNFTKIISLLETIPEYNPKNTALTLAGLKALLTELTQTNTAVLNYYGIYKPALDARDDLMYAENTGLTNLAIKVKEFTKTLGGVKDPRYINIKSIKFKNLKGK